jgi:hypothetical protein
MIVLKLLFIVVVYVGVAVFLAWLLARRRQTPKAKAIAATLTLLVFALIPTWDILPGRLYFNHLCATEGGLKIYKTVEGVDGFYFFPGAEFRREALEKFGYEFVEAGSKESGYVRYTFASNEIVRKEIIALISKYAIRGSEDLLPLNIKRRQEAILDLNSNEKLAERNIFYYSGNWLQVRMKPVLGGGEYCPRFQWTENILRSFYVDTLRPTPRRN